MAVPLEESATSMRVSWSTDYRSEGEIFIALNRKGGGMRAIVGYPTEEIVRMSQNPRFVLPQPG